MHSRCWDKGEGRGRGSRPCFFLFSHTQAYLQKGLGPGAKDGSFRQKWEVASEAAPRCLGRWLQAQGTGDTPRAEEDEARRVQGVGEVQYIKRDEVEGDKVRFKECPLDPRGFCGGHDMVSGTRKMNDWQQLQRDKTE